MLALGLAASKYLSHHLSDRQFCYALKLSSLETLELSFSDNWHGIQGQLWDLHPLKKDQKTLQEFSIFKVTKYFITLRKRNRVNYLFQYFISDMKEVLPFIFSVIFSHRAE